MIHMIYKTWFNHWKVVEVGHTEGDYTWVATFRTEIDAHNFVAMLEGRR